MKINRDHTFLIILILIKCAISKGIFTAPQFSGLAAANERASRAVDIMEKHISLDIKPVTDDEQEILLKYYKGYTRRFLRAGPQGYLCSPGYGDHAADIHNLEVRPDDVWVTSFSRSGTTWLQELAWLVANNLDFEQATSVPIIKRYAYIE